MRLSVTLSALVVATGLGACGGDDQSSSRSSTTSTAATTSSTATAPRTTESTTGSTPTATTQVPSPAALSPKPGGKRLTRAQTRAFYVARRSCLDQGVSGIAAKAKIDSDDERQVAQAYVRRSFGSRVQGAALRGCLVGFR